MQLARPVLSSAACAMSYVAVTLLTLFFVPLQARAQRRAFYIRPQRYRFGAADPRCSKQGHCNLEFPLGREYSLNFIEFKDDGNPYDQAQIDEAVHQLHAALSTNDGKVVVFIYIHGWHNSAEERKQKKNPNCAQRLYTGDVDKFRHCGLEIIAQNSPPTPPGAAPRIVGIYLAWPGWDLGWPILSGVPSYYLRMPKARSIGLSGMNDALDKIFGEIQASDPQKKQHLTIVMGHSFGARALESALDGLPDRPGLPPRKQGILQKYRNTSFDQRIGTDPLPVDMVFYANAATSHADTIRTEKDWDKKCNDHLINGCMDDPLYVAVSSRADIETAIIMPIANLIAMPIGFALHGTGYSDGYHLISAANTPWMQTHQIPVHPAQTPALSPEEGFCFVVPAVRGPGLTYVVDAKPKKTPYRLWAMETDHWNASLVGFVHKIPGLGRLVPDQWVISSHGDVWNAGVFNMVRSIIDTQTERIEDHSAKVACGQTIKGQQLNAGGN